MRANTGTHRLAQLTHEHTRAQKSHTHQEEVCEERLRCLQEGHGVFAGDSQFGQRHSCGPHRVTTGWCECRWGSTSALLVLTLPCVLTLQMRTQTAINLAPQCARICGQEARWTNAQSQIVLE